MERVPAGIDAREWLNTSKEDRALDEYNNAVPEDHFHRRLTAGTPRRPTNCTREEEVLIHRLRLNRAPFLQACAARHGRTGSPICQFCNRGDQEDTEHFLWHCPRWDEERGRTLDDEMDDNPTAFLEFYESTGRTTLSPNL